MHFVTSMFTQQFLSRPRILVTVCGIILLAAVACSDNPNAPGGTNPPSGCIIITGVTTTTFPSSGGSASISVSTTSSCSWTAVSSAGFLTVNSGKSGSGDGVVQFSVDPNTGPERTAILTITGTAITITQR